MSNFIITNDEHTKNQLIEAGFVFLCYSGNSTSSSWVFTHDNKLDFKLQEIDSSKFEVTNILKF